MTLDIRSWRDIDADYLTRILAAKGIDATVVDIEKKPVGTGQIGDCFRFTLAYESEVPHAPKTLVGKFAAEAEESRQTGIMLGNYIREVKFYQILQPKARITTPDIYCAEINEETHEFVLLMSDASPAVQGDQLKGISIDEAKTIIKEAAKLHSAFWRDDSLNQHAWVFNTPNAPIAFDMSVLPQIWGGFQARYGNLVSDRAKHLGDAICRNYEPFREAQTEQVCLTHGDFRPDNMMFATPEGGKPLTVVDWQGVAYGPAAADVGNCLSGALAPELRREHEPELLKLYASELDRLGAGPYPFDDLKKHYVLGGYQHFLTAFFASMFVTETERGNEMFLKMLNGAVELVYDHQAEDWFV